MVNYYSVRGIEKLGLGTHVTRDFGRVLVIGASDVMPLATEIRADNAFQACRPYPHHGHYVVVIYPHDNKGTKVLMRLPEGESPDPTKQHYHGVQV